MARSPGQQVADERATVVIGAEIVIGAETCPRFRCNLSPYSTVPLGPLRARKSPTQDSVAAVEPGRIDQLDIPIRLASAEELGREALLRETQELRFVSTEQAANVAQSLELLDPNRVRSPLRFP